MEDDKRLVRLLDNLADVKDNIIEVHKLKEELHMPFICYVIVAENCEVIEEALENVSFKELDAIVSVMAVEPNGDEYRLVYPV